MGETLLEFMLKNRPLMRKLRNVITAARVYSAGLNYEITQFKQEQNELDEILAKEILSRPKRITIEKKGIPSYVS